MVRYMVLNLILIFPLGRRLALGHIAVGIGSRLFAWRGLKHRRLRSQPAGQVFAGLALAKTARWWR